MKASLVLFCCYALLVLSGCVSPRAISVSHLNRTNVNYEQGIAVLKSAKTHGVVIRLLSTTFSNETSQLPALLIGFANGTDKSIDFSTYNVSCRSG